MGSQRRTKIVRNCWSQVFCSAADTTGAQPGKGGKIENIEMLQTETEMPGFRVLVGTGDCTEFLRR